MWLAYQIPFFAKGNGASRGIVILIVFGKLDWVSAGNDKD